MNRMFLLVSAVPHLVLAAMLAMTIAGIAALLGKRQNPLFELNRIAYQGDTLLPVA